MKTASAADRDQLQEATSLDDWMNRNYYSLTLERMDELCMQAKKVEAWVRLKADPEVRAHASQMFRNHIPGGSPGQQKLQAFHEYLLGRGEELGPEYMDGIADFIMFGVGSTEYRAAALAQDPYIHELVDNVRLGQKAGDVLIVEGSLESMRSRMIKLGVPEQDTWELEEIVLKAAHGLHDIALKAGAALFPDHELPEWQPFHITDSRFFSSESCGYA